MSKRRRDDAATSIRNSQVTKGYATEVHRLLRLLTLMQQGEVGNAAVLAEHLGVTERTVYRDLAVLTDLGVPHDFDEEDGRYRVWKDRFLPPVQLSAGETLALLCLANEIGGGEQITLTGPASRAMEKISGQLPQGVLDGLSDGHEHIDVKLPASGPAGE